MTFKKKMSKRTDSKRVERPGLSSEKFDKKNVNNKKIIYIKIKK